MINHALWWAILNYIQLIYWLVLQKHFTLRSLFCTSQYLSNQWLSTAICSNYSKSFAFLNAKRNLSYSISHQQTLFDFLIVIFSLNYINWLERLLQVFDFNQIIRIIGVNQKICMFLMTNHILLLFQHGSIEVSVGTITSVKVFSFQMVPENTQKNVKDCLSKHNVNLLSICTSLE